MCSLCDKEGNIQSGEVGIDVRLSPVVYEWCTHINTQADTHEHISLFPSLALCFHYFIFSSDLVKSFIHQCRELSEVYFSCVDVRVISSISSSSPARISPVFPSMRCYSWTGILHLSPDHHGKVMLGFTVFYRVTVGNSKQLDTNDFRNVPVLFYCFLLFSCLHHLAGFMLENYTD